MIDSGSENDDDNESNNDILIDLDASEKMMVFSVRLAT